MDDRLFEAKARFAGEYVLYNIYRVAPNRYEAQLIKDENEVEGSAPTQLVVTKENGQWQTNNLLYQELGSTLGIEIDVFNNGYGEILGRIGVR